MDELTPNRKLTTRQLPKSRGNLVKNKTFQEFSNRPFWTRTKKSIDRFFSIDKDSSLLKPTSSKKSHQ